MRVSRPPSAARHRSCGGMRKTIPKLAEARIDSSSNAQGERTTPLITAWLISLLSPHSHSAT